MSDIYIKLYTTVKEVTSDYVLEPSIKYIFSAGKLVQNRYRYSILIPKYHDAAIILSKLNIMGISTIFSYIIKEKENMNENTSVDFIIGVDNDILKIYLDYGHKIISILIFENMAPQPRKEYLVTKSPHDALKYAYLFKLINFPLLLYNWRHVYHIKDQNEFHISLLSPTLHNNHLIYLVGITPDTITLYYR